ncbi:MAG: glycosyltransferase family 39 protein [Nanoarchaeota archaeon]|nr:glycosyltransferase family 39 protein [Nanoarchaeota archaeon]
MKQKIKLDWKILLLIVLFLIYIFILIIRKTNLFWDATIYISMSKYLLTFGKLGFYELIRPPFFSLTMGVLWLFGIKSTVAGHIIVISSTILSIFLVYLISKEIFSKKNAIIPTLLFAIAPTLVFFGSRVLNDNFSMSISFLAIYLFIKKKSLFLIGIIIGLSTLIRFPNMLLMAAIGLFFIFELITNQKKNKSKEFINLIKKCIFLFLGFLIILTPYLIFNNINFGNPIEPFRQASETIHIVSQSINEGILYYPTNLLLDSIFIIFSLCAIFFLFKQKINKNKPLWLLLITSTLFFVYYSTVGHKETRYMLIIYPYIFLLSYYGLSQLFNKLKLKPNLKKIILSIILILCILQSINGTNAYYKSYAVPFDEELGKEYYSANLPGFSIISGPQVLAYQDIDAEIIYWTRPGMFEYYEELNPSNYLINDCNLFCPQGDIKCNTAKQTFINKLKEKYTIYFHKDYNDCNYYLFN